MSQASTTSLTNISSVADITLWGLTRLGRRLRFVAWLGVAAPCIFFLAQPFLLPISLDEVTSTSKFQQLQGDLLKSANIEFAQQLDAFRKNDPKPNANQLQEFSKSVRRQIRKDATYTSSVNPFWFVSIKVYADFQYESTDGPSQINLPREAEATIGNNLHLDSLPATFAVTLLLIFLPLALARTEAPRQEPTAADQSREILTKQLIASIDQVQFVRTMALFQLAAGVLVAFMGIVVYAIYFAPEENNANELAWLAHRQSAVDRVLVAGTFGPGPVTEAFDRATTATTPGRFEDKSPSFAASASPSGAATPTLENLVAIHKQLSTIDPKFFNPPSWWDRINWTVITRGVGILIFIEAVAWFLLQQYRRAMEDYKEFQRRAIKRGNIVAAHAMLSSTTLNDGEKSVLAALLTEDLTGVLRKDETTEGNQRVGIPDEGSPIFALLRDLLSTVTGQAGGGTTKPT